jgi:hypothetical protein
MMLLCLETGCAELCEDFGHILTNSQSPTCGPNSRSRRYIAYQVEPGSGHVECSRNASAFLWSFSSHLGFLTIMGWELIAPADKDFDL